MNASNLEDELAQWRAERAITRVIQSYARAVDARDFGVVRDCFFPDARIHYGDWFEGDLEAAIEFLVDSVPRLQSTLHIFGAPWIELDLAAGTAAVETYAVNSAVYVPDADGVSMQNVSGTRYQDRFDCRDGQWGILTRRNQRAWAHNLPETGEPLMPSEAAARAALGADPGQDEGA